MLKLQPFEICKLQDFCIYGKDCRGLDNKRRSVFSCIYADEIRQEDEKKVCQFSVCSLKSPTATEYS